MRKILYKETSLGFLLSPLQLHGLLQARNIVCFPREDPFGPLCFAQLMSNPLAHNSCPCRRHNRSVCESGSWRWDEMTKKRVEFA